MRRSRRTSINLLRIGAIAAAAGILAPAHAAAQAQPSPLRFLKPWIEQRLGLSPDAGPEASAEPAPPAGAETQRSEIDPRAAQTSPAEERPVEGEGEGIAATRRSPETLPQTGTDLPSGLRGSVAETEPLSPSGVAAEAPGPHQAAPAPYPPGEAPPAAAAPAAAPAPPLPPPPLRFGVIAGRSVAATMAATAPIPEALSTILGRTVEFLPVSSYGAMIDAQVQRRIDGGFYSAGAFAAADAGCRCLEPIAAPRAADGTLAYHAIIVARAGSGIASLADLAGRKVTAGPADSVGARRMQLAGLLAEGFDPADLGALVTVASPLDAVRLLMAGGADAAFAWSSLTGDLQRGHSRGTLADMVASGELAMADVAIVWRSPPIAHGPMAVLKSLPEQDKRRIESYLVGLEASEPAAYDRLNPLYSGGYVAVEPEDYHGLDVLVAGDLDVVTLPPTPGD